MVKIGCFVIFLLTVCIGNVVYAEQSLTDANIKASTNAECNKGSSESDKNANVVDKNVKKNIKNTIKDNVSLYHIVQPGDNIYRLSLKYKVSREDLIKLNKLNGSNIKVGQKLLLPSDAHVVFLDGREKNDSFKTTAPIYVADDKENNVDVSKNRAQKTASKQQQGTFVDKIGYTSFLWPSRGIILSKFGHKTQSGRMEGINILVEDGSSVRASTDGEVVYNDSVIGFDNVIIIRHYNNFFTAYGHTAPVVVVGDKVKKGQIIAYVSKDKQSNKSVLYFTIRKNGKSYDPEKIIQTKISN